MTLICRAICQGMLAFALFVTAHPVLAGEQFAISERTLLRMEKQFGPEARIRLLAWQELVRGTNGDDRAKLEAVNRFFNNLHFVDDALHWQLADYSATPIELIASSGGDCEDFAIARYFTLIKLGIAEERLTLTYVKTLRLNKAHMVLTYNSKPGTEPLVLDNLIGSILPSSKRTDLLPVYSVSGAGLWLAKQRNSDKWVGSGDRL